MSSLEFLLLARIYEAQREKKSSKLCQRETQKWYRTVLWPYLQSGLVHLKAITYGLLGRDTYIGCGVQSPIGRWLCLDKMSMDKFSIK